MLLTCRASLQQLLSNQREERVKTKSRSLAGVTPEAGLVYRLVGRLAVVELRKPPTARRRVFLAVLLELLQQLEVVVAGNAEQVPDAGLLETAKQKIADRHLFRPNGRCMVCCATVDSDIEATGRFRFFGMSSVKRGRALPG